MQTSFITMGKFTEGVVVDISPDVFNFVNNFIYNNLNKNEIIFSLGVVVSSSDKLKVVCYNSLDENDYDEYYHFNEQANKLEDLVYEVLNRYAENCNSGIVTLCINMLLYEVTIMKNEENQVIENSM